MKMKTKRGEAIMEDLNQPLPSTDEVLAELRHVQRHIFFSIFLDKIMSSDQDPR